MMMMVAAMMPVIFSAAREADRPQFETGDTGRDVQPGLALQADRLQRIGIRGAADEKITAAADADRSVEADAAIIPGQTAATEPAVRCIHRPGELGLLGDAEIETQTAHGGDIGFRTAAFAPEHTFEGGYRTNNEADIRAALALQDAGANRRLRVGADDRCRKRNDGDTECQSRISLVSA